jgi:hypothetical protein
MANTNTARITRQGRLYAVEFFRDGLSLGTVQYRTKANMVRNLRAYGVVAS